MSYFVTIMNIGMHFNNQVLKLFKKNVRQKLFPFYFMTIKIHCKIMMILKKITPQIFINFSKE